MKPLVLVLVLGAAVLHAGWNALAKKGGDPLLRLALIIGGSALCGLPLAIWLGPPPSVAWPMLMGSVVMHQLYFATTVLGYRHGDLSTVYPIARGSAPVLVSIGAAVTAHEFLDPVGIAAVVVISAGVASLAFIGDGRRNLRSVGYAFASAISIAIFSVTDGLGGRAAGTSVMAYICWLFVLQGIPIAVFTAVARRASLREAISANWRGGLGGGAAAILAYGLVIWAMSITPMSYVAALRELSVVLAALIGTKLLGEPFGPRRVAAAVVVACGVVLLQVTR